VGLPSGLGRQQEVYDLEERIEEYLQAGVRLIWVIHPEVRVIQIFRADGSSSRIRAGDELSGEDVLPGFRCPVDALFPTAQTAGHQAAPTG
jgi:Uma2 family endonuclease